MKIPLSLMISLSAIFGFIINKNSIDSPLLLTAAAIFLLACGGACLNNYQDRHIDRLFSRTRHRALPSGSLPPGQALVLSVALIFSGTMLLYLIRYDVLLPFLGAAAILLYNGIYTPLKPRSILAIIPGSMCGMIPPLIGWSAAGGDLFSLKIVSIMVLFGIWQLPHFWLILLNHYSEYSRSDLPNMLHCFSRFQLEKIVFIWIVNFSVMLLFIPILYWGHQNTTGWILATAAFVLISVAFLNIFQSRHQKDYIPSFKYLHGTIFIAMLVIIVGRLI